MARLHLVRHGEAAAGWDTDLDPGLSPLGHEQARAVAATFDDPLPIITSPLRRCRETAAPLAQRWDVEPRIEPGVAEIPTPTDLGLAERGPWLASLMAGTWPVDGPLRHWCDDVIAALADIPTDAVVFTHFIAINVAIGRATADERVLCARAGNCSVTVVDVDVDLAAVRLVAAPDEARTEVV